MITAVDSSILICIAKGEALAERCVTLLARARAEGVAVIGDLDRLAALDRGYLRAYFPKLEVLSP